MVRSLFFVLTLAGCAGDSHDHTEGEGLIGEDVAWLDKTHEEKHSWMTFRVLPEMRDRFEAFDPAFVGEFSCASCHGDDTANTGFDTLPHMTGPAELSVSDWPSNSADVDVLAFAAFMEDEVAPAMAALVDTVVAPTPQDEGLTCGTCHMIVQ